MDTCFNIAITIWKLEVVSKDVLYWPRRVQDKSQALVYFPSEHHAHMKFIAFVVVLSRPTSCSRTSRPPNSIDRRDTSRSNSAFYGTSDPRCTYGYLEVISATYSV